METPQLPTLPFLRTIKQVPQKGVVKTAAMLLAIALKGANEKLKYLPKKTVACINNSKMYLYPRQGGIDYDLYLYKKRKPLCTDFLLRSHLLRESNTVLDIGANVGYTCLLSRSLWENGERLRR